MKRNTAGILIGIPLIIFIIEVICIMSVFFLTGSEDDLLWVPETMGLLIPVLAPIPCLVLSIIGTIMANKAVKEGNIKAKRIYYLGIVEISAGILFIPLAGYFFYCIAGGA